MPFRLPLTVDVACGISRVCPATASAAANCCAASRPPPLPRRRYVDYPITDVLQMMGRAGRPQYDRHGVAVIMVSFLAFRLSAT